MTINNCPFCGSDEFESAAIESGVEETLIHWIHCNKCDSEGSEQYTEAEAIAEWNKPGDKLSAVRKLYVELTNSVSFADNGEACYLADQELMDKFDKLFD